MAAAIVAIRHKGATFAPEEGVDLANFEEDLPDHEDCIKSGMLSRKSQGARGHWAPRFVILTSSELIFCKLSDDGKRSRLDCVPLHEIVSVSPKEAENEEGGTALESGASTRDLKRSVSVRHMDMDDEEDNGFSFLIQVCASGADAALRIANHEQTRASGFEALPQSSNVCSIN